MHAFVSSRLDYCNTLYVEISQSMLSRLQIVQNTTARLLTGCWKRDHITPILSSLHWLPACYIIDFKIVLFVFKSLNGLAPSYLSDLLQPYSPSRSLRSSDHKLLIVPRVRHTVTVGGPCFCSDPRTASTLVTFKSLLKTQLFSQALLQNAAQCLVVRTSMFLSDFFYVCVV